MRVRKAKVTLSQKPTSIVERGGMTFFWILNDACDRALLSAQLREFQKTGVEALVLHPRGGLLLPYGSADWFELIQWLAGECLSHSIEPILYDEDPYPSGNAGGRLIADFPELAGAAIERFTPSDPLAEGALFIFPRGRLCWAGIVFPTNPKRTPINLTSSVGMIRRHWEKAEWNSKWYYPATPIYSCPRAFALHAEFALRCPLVPAGGKIVAFVARTITNGGEWGGLVDTLNPEATQRYLQSTHDRYAHYLKGMLGKSVRAIFTDEAKPHATYSWTPGIFESFQSRYGYDLRPQLEHLFSPRESRPSDTPANLRFMQGQSPEGMRVRLDYREWIAERFDEVWLKPVAEWSSKHGLALIGHLSPEEDPVSQSASIGNLFPLQKRLALPGFDLIIPAVGDKDHPLLNVASVLSISAAQQNRQDGVCCESLGAFGLSVPLRKVASVLAWQVLHGVSLAVLHGVFSSNMGLRRYEAPPDYGPTSDLWEPIMRIRRVLEPFFSATLGAKQDAPVAILWPIRSFQALGLAWQPENSGLRKDLVDLLNCCLRNQIGVHLIDEEGLTEGAVEGDRLVVGKAAYQWVLIPSATVIGEAAFKRLNAIRKAGVRVLGVGAPLEWVRPDNAQLRRAGKCEWPQHAASEFLTKVVGLLPRLVDIRGEGSEEFHTTVWQSGRGRELLVMNFGSKRRAITLARHGMEFSPGELVWFQEINGSWAVHARFAPGDYRGTTRREVVARFGEWRIHLPGWKTNRSSQPLAAYQLVAGGASEFVHTIVTREMNVAGKQVAESITYGVDVTFPRGFKRAILCVEPTLMRGKFTLKIGKMKWEFAVHDTESTIQQIDISAAVKPGRLAMAFVLHQPEAPDGIKSNPRIQLEI